MYKEMNLLVYVLNATHAFTRRRTMELQPVPPSFDWRDHMDLGQVHQQGHCQACWAFSALAWCRLRTGEGVTGRW